MAHPTTSSDPVLPEAKMNLVTPAAPVTARIVSSRRCMKGKSASFVRHVAFDVTGTPIEGNFLVGQSFGVVPPGVDEKGKPHKVRLYSIACPSWGEDGRGRIVSTTPKRVIDERTPQKDGDDPDDWRLFLGVCSNYICDQRVGAEVQVTGPSGKRFLLPADTEAHDYLFLATGTGIAPFRGMAMELLDRPGGPTASRIDLVMGAPYTTDLLYDDLFTKYAEEHEDFHYHTAISRERRPDGRRGLYVDGLLEERIDEFRDVFANPRTVIYICGLVGMQMSLYRILVKHGLHEGYLVMKDEIAGVDPDEWDVSSVKRYIRPTGRLMIEVY